MESEFPQSVREAQEHIRAIRRDKGLGDGPDQIGNNAADLEAALQVLSNDIYQTPTHFLLELIQNADDNSYTAEVPTLSISYSKGYIRVDCNERGFARKNVEAICRICQSTKSGRSKSAGFVGEKGIGFKAVFKVANKVWISSGHYSFRFDRDAHLGMIAPIWDKFPKATKPGYTSVLLKLTGNSNEAGIIKELKSHDERTLLFLRRLRRLEIDVNLGTFSLKKPYKTILGRQGGSSATASTMVLLRDGVKKHYFVYRHQATKLPKEARRPGITSSEIVLAFPHTAIDGSGPVKPIIESQNVYAFLPIRDAGFPFLLQADFLLSANREDVHLDPLWNKTLALSAAVAFCKAVLHAGTLSNGLRYSWVEYIPNFTAKTTFFDNLRHNIIVQLKKSKILEAQSGIRKKPADLLWVPKRFLDPSGRLFGTCGKNGDKYLAGKYETWGAAGPAMDILGVEIMDVRSFYEAMGRALKNRPGNFFAAKSDEWHSSFARALAYKSRPHGVPDLPVIPLHNGEWVSRGYGTYFPGRASAIPEGIGFTLVDAKAAANPDRKTLFREMGVKDISNYEIEEVIYSTHSSQNFKADQLRPEVLISHAVFLYGLWKNDNKARTASIWMAADVGNPRKSEKMYFSSKAPNSASRLLPHVAESDYGFLHPGYFKVDVPDNGSWLDFLQKHCQVCFRPRLFNPIRIGSGSALRILHDDFLAAMELPDNTWLKVLKDGWLFYNEWLGGLSRDPYITSYTREITNLVSYLACTKVLCRGGGDLVPLKDTYFPYERLTENYGDLVPFVDIPDPNNTWWVPIARCFGVREEADARFYVACLSGARKNPKTSVERIKQVMHRLEDCLDRSSADLDHVRKRMDEEPLIHIPPKGEGRENERGTWALRTNCFWRGEPWITQYHGLEKTYPDLEVLFRTHLSIPNAGTKHYIGEAREFSKSPRTPVPHIERVFVALTAQIKAGNFGRQQEDEIRKLQIVPVAGPGDGFRCLVSALTTRPWLIADRENLRCQFWSELSLCLFAPAFVLKVKPLFVLMGLGDKFLSELVTSVTEAEGEGEFHRELTKKFWKRSKYLFRLIPENQADHEHLRSKFSTVSVFVAPKIVQYYNVPFGLRQITSLRSEGAAFLESDTSGMMCIYLRAGHEKDPYPFELAEQLRAFFNIAPGHRDLLAAAMTAPEERVEQLFDHRGIAPLPDEDGASGEGEEVTVGPVRFPPGPSKASKMRLGGQSRFTRLLSSTRFGPSFFDNVDAASGNLPPYDLAVERSTHNAIGRPVEPRSFLDGLTLAGLNDALGKMEFVQKEGAVVGMPTVESSVFDRFRSWAQRDSDAAEAMVSGILAVVLGREYNKTTMWQKRRQRGAAAAFAFADTQGKFSSFLMRLEGLSGKAQGYTRLVYHLDVKASDSGDFELTQSELGRARRFSVHSQPNPAQKAPSKDVAVLVHISNLRSEPRIRFLTDPWDLFQDGQLKLESRTTYKASLKLRERRLGGGGEAGFDAIQIRDRGGEDEEEVPGYDEGGSNGTKKLKGKKWKGKGRAVNA